MDPMQDPERQVSRLASKTKAVMTLVGALLGLPFSVVMWWFVYKALRPYATSPVFAWHTEVNETALPGQCFHEWHMLHFTMNGGIAVFIMCIILAFFQFCGLTFCEILLYVVETITMVCLTFISLRGLFVTLFFFNWTDEKHCQDVHNTAWWFYAGILFLSCAASCCCVLSGGALTAMLPCLRGFLPINRGDDDDNSDGSDSESKTSE